MKRFITQKEFDYSTEIFYSLYLYDVILKIPPYDWVNRVYDFLNHIGIPLKSVIWVNEEHDGLCSISKYMERGCSTINEDHLITLYSSIVQRYCAECYLRCAYLHWNFLNYDMSTDIEFKIADTALRKVQLSPIQFITSIKSEFNKSWYNQMIILILVTELEMPLMISICLCMNNRSHTS